MTVPSFSVRTTHLGALADDLLQLPGVSDRTSKAIYDHITDTLFTKMGYEKDASGAWSVSPHSQKKIRASEKFRVSDLMAAIGLSRFPDVRTFEALPQYLAAAGRRDGIHLSARPTKFSWVCGPRGGTHTDLEKAELEVTVSHTAPIDRRYHAGGHDGPGWYDDVYV